MYGGLCNGLLPRWDILVLSCGVRSDPPCAELDRVLQRRNVPGADFPLLASRPARKGWRYHQSFLRRPGWSAPPNHGTTFYGCCLSRAVTLHARQPLEVNQPRPGPLVGVPGRAGRKFREDVFLEVTHIVVISRLSDSGSPNPKLPRAHRDVPRSLPARPLL